MPRLDDFGIPTMRSGRPSPFYSAKRAKMARKGPAPYGFQHSGTFNKSSVGTRLPAGLQGAGWTVLYDDGLMPASITIDNAIKGGLNVVGEAMGKMAAQGIIDIYDAGGRPTWQPVSPGWLRIKMEAGFDARTMHMTNNLEHVVHMLPWTLTSGFNPLNSRAMFGAITLNLDRAFAQANYVWVHELIGVGRYKVRRPFIFQGLMKGYAAATRSLQKLIEILDNQIPVFDNTNWNFPIVLTRGGKLKTAPAAPAATAAAGRRTTPITTRPRALPFVVPQMPAMITPIGEQYAIHEAVFTPRVMGIIWWLMPPSKLWAVYGATSDIMAFVSGELLTPTFFAAWGGAFLRGKAGGVMGVPTTKKMVRRGFKRRLWRGR